MVSDSAIKPGTALLPHGFYDALPAEAIAVERARRVIIDHLSVVGYDLVSPPLVEFDTGEPRENAATALRMMDMESQQMMAVRSDITPQLARLATTRLATAPRPLRLCYAGNVIRAKGSQLRPTRQYMQIGAELIGSAHLEAEAEVVVAAVEALLELGLSNLSVDLSTPRLGAIVLQQMQLNGDQAEAVRAALLIRDSGALNILGDEERVIFEALIQATGPAADGLAKLEALSLAGEAGRLVARLARLVDMLAKRLPRLQLTVDPCETLGFDYKTGIAFSLFALGTTGELGRGGRYTLKGPHGTESATGFSLYLDRILDVLPQEEHQRPVFAPLGTDAAVVSSLRAAGVRVVEGLSEDPDALQEARRLHCSSMIRGGEIVTLDTNGETD